MVWGILFSNNELKPVIILIVFNEDLFLNLIEKQFRYKYKE
jgi:hypothetical protein